jgi:hypothetical protein
MNLNGKKLLLSVALIAVSLPAAAKTHKEQYNMPCPTLWTAVKDVLKNSGKYGIVGISNEEMTSTYNIGGTLTGKRTNSLVLNPKDGGCELQVQTAYSGLVNNDEADFKKRLDESLAKQGPPAPAQTPPVSTKPNN